MFIEPLEPLTLLQELYLSSTEITNIDALHNMTRLRLLDLSYNFIQSINSLENITGLQELYLNSNQINNITQLRNHFFATMGQLTTKPLTEVVENLDWMPLITYLNSTADLLELGVKKANYPFVLNYQPFSNSTAIVGTNNGKTFIIQTFFSDLLKTTKSL